MDILSFPLFFRLKAETAEKLKSYGREILLREGEVLHTVHDACLSISFVMKGKLSITRMLPSGKEYHLRTLKEGDSFGEAAALSSDAHYPGWITALTATKVFEINIDHIVSFMDYPDFRRHFLKDIADHSLFLVRRLELVNLKSIREKIAWYLINSIEAERSPHTITLNKGELASLLGNSREAVSRVLTEIEKEGILRRTGARDVEIVELEKLEDILLRS